MTPKDYLDKCKKVLAELNQMKGDPKRLKLEEMEEWS